jgi:hypothetical protein
MALDPVRYAHTLDTHQRGLPSETIQHPNQPQGPSNSGIAAQTVPAKQQINADLLTGYQSCEDDEDSSACIVGKLEKDDLRQYAGWGQIRKCTGSRGAASARHQYGL